MLFHLPDKVLASILDSWMRCKSLVKLDTAICNKLCRVELLAILSATWFKFHPKCSITSTNINWFQLRELRVDRADISHVKDQHTLEILKQWNHLFSLKMCCSMRMYDAHLHATDLDIMNRCFGLIKNVSCLEKLEVEFDTTETAMMLLNILPIHAQQLVTLKISWKYERTRGDSVHLKECADVLKSCKELRTLELSHFGTSTRVDIKHQRNAASEHSVWMSNVEYSDSEALDRDVVVFQSFNLVGFHFSTQSGWVSGTSPHLWKQMLVDHHTLKKICFFSQINSEQIACLLLSNPCLSEIVVEIGDELATTRSDWVTVLTQCKCRKKLKSLHVMSHNNANHITATQANAILTACPYLVNFSFVNYYYTPDGSHDYEVRLHNLIRNPALYMEVEVPLCFDDQGWIDWTGEIDGSCNCEVL